MNKQKKETRVTIRLTTEQYESICARADAAHMTPSAYIRAAAMRHKVVVIDGLKEFTHELKGMGRNLNQLTILANEGRFSSPDLSGMADGLDRIYCGLVKLAEQEKR